MFPVFVRCVLVIAMAGLILLGFFFSAILLVDFIRLRPDVICGLMLLVAIVIATLEQASDDDGR